MSGGGEFQDKATRLFNRLNAVTQPAKLAKTRTESTAPAASPQELLKIKEEIEASDYQARKKMRVLTDNLKKLQVSLTDQNENRAKMDEIFTQSVVKLEKQMKSVLNSVQKSFQDKEKKLQEKIEALIKSERKEIEGKLLENQGLLQQMQILESKVMAMAGEVAQLRRTRIEVQERITRQFNDQLRDFKRIFQNDVRERQQKQGRSMTSLKSLYKGAIERIVLEQRQREESEKMLMAVVEQLVTHIIEA